MGKANVYTHCAACDTSLSGRQPINKTTGEVSDLCGVCRNIVRKACYFHYEDVEALEKDVWRVQMGQGDLWNSNEGSSHNADASYQGTGSCD
jgi:hypothetical protein